MPEDHPQHRRTTHTATEEKAAAEEEKAEATATTKGAEVEATAADENPDPWKVKYHPMELPANTAAAQAYITMHPDDVDETLDFADERTAAAQNEIGVYGHPDDPRLSGASLVTAPLSAEDLATPGKKEIEELEVRTEYRTWGEKLEEDEAAEGKSTKKEEAKA